MKWNVAEIRRNEETHTMRSTLRLYVDGYIVFSFSKEVLEMFPFLESYIYDFIERLRKLSKNGITYIGGEKHD